MKLELGKYTFIEKGALKAYFDIHFVDIGLVVQGCKLFMNERGPWIKFPDKEYKSKEGDTKYQAFLNFPLKEKYIEFETEALSLLQTQTEMGKKNNGPESTQAKVHTDTPPNWNDLPF